jgi:outer membrane protein OmpA-like peptidoglycan-associated protein
MKKITAVMHLLVKGAFAVLFISGCGGGKEISKSRSGQQRQLDPMAQAIIYSRKGSYDEALEIYNTQLEEQPGHPEKLARRGTVYYEMGRKVDAYQDFNTILRDNPDFDPEIYYSAGITAMEIGKYGEAASLFDQYINNNKSNMNKVSKARKLLENATFRQGIQNEKYNIIIEEVPGEVNTSYSEYLPILSLDQSKMIFTRRIGGQEDLYIASWDGNSWVDAREVTGVNTASNEGAHTISSDGKTIIFTACNRKYGVGGCDLFRTIFKDEAWTPAVALDNNVNTPAWDAQPCLSADGTKLFFCSSRYGGYGGHDIWYCEKDEKGDWMKAKNIGQVINTKGSEESPFIHPDGKTLYFRSNGHPGMGSFDLFKSTYDTKTKTWSTPENLGPPINTEADEGAMTVSLDGGTAYFASDINSIKNNEVRKHLNILQFNVPEHLRPSPVTYIKATVYNAKTKEKLNAEASLTNQTNQSTILEKIDDSGEFIFSLPQGSEYTLSIDKKGYKYHLDLLNLREEDLRLEPIALNIYLTPIEIAKQESEPLLLRHIYFESGSAILKKSSNYEIEKLYQLLSEDSEISIKILGHTDDVGNAEVNLNLSEARAQSVKDALILKGIDGNRIVVQGMGESDPIADNGSEESRALNRRTEIVISKR